MEIDFIKLMTSKSDEGLNEYIVNRLKYNPEAVFAAIEELKKRGKVFKDTEIDSIKSDIERQKEISVQRNAESESGWNKWKKNVVDDIDAPEYYSERAIYGFSVIFSVLFGSVLMAINLNKTENKNIKWTAVLFGILYTGLQMWALSFIPRNSGLTLMTSVGGALILNHFFWKKHIGKDTKYRAQQIWKPLIIGLLILLPFLYLIIMYGQE